MTQTASKVWKQKSSNAFERIRRGKQIAVVQRGGDGQGSPY